MSAGAMVAGGMAFTLPGLWIVGVWSGPQVLADHWWEVLAIGLAGMILGALLTWRLRPKYIEQGVPCRIPSGSGGPDVDHRRPGRKKITALIWGYGFFRRLYLSP